MFVSVAVVSGVLISAVWDPDISTDRKFVHSALAKGSYGWWRCPFVTSTGFKWDEGVKDGSADTESQAKSPFLFLMRADSGLLLEHPRAQERFRQAEKVT